VFLCSALVFTGLDFVAAKVLLGLDKQHTLAQLGGVLPEAKLLGSVHSVLASVVNALARLLAYEADQFALVTFFRHIAISLTDTLQFVNSCFTL